MTDNNKQPDDIKTIHSQSNWFREHWQFLINIFLFLALSIGAGIEIHKRYINHRLGYVEIAFALQNIILVLYILIRKQHRDVDRNIFNQFIALVTFFSGLAIFSIEHPLTPHPTALIVSQIVTFMSNSLGAVTLLNLGRSFGILIAFREVKSGGLYSIVRHPMYGTDILLRIGFVISHFSWLTILILVASSGCYIYRAILEERFLSKQPDYAEYMKIVKYRFIPYIF